MFTADVGTLPREKADRYIIISFPSLSPALNGEYRILMHKLQ